MNAHRDGHAVLARVARDHMGFLSVADLAAVAADPTTRLTPILVRCGGCRFTAPADQTAHLIAIITREGSDYVRDVALLADHVGQLTGGGR